MTASKDYDGSTDGSIISSYFLEIEATSFYLKKRRRQHQAMKKTGERRIKLWFERRGYMIGPNKFLFRQQTVSRVYIKVLCVRSSLSILEGAYRLYDKGRTSLIKGIRRRKTFLHSNVMTIDKQLRPTAGTEGARRQKKMNDR